MTHRLALPIVMAIAIAACTPKNVKVREEPEWSTEAGQERVRIQLIEALIERGNGREALMLISTSREKGDNDPSLELYQASALMITGMGDEAERLLLVYLGDRPRDERAWRKLGILQADAGRVDQAIASFIRATELDDEHADTWNNLGFMYLTQDRFTEATEALRQAIAFDGTKIRYRNNLGFALVGIGELGRALQAFMSVSPPADAHANMGLALERGGDTAAATEQYSLALQYNPEHTASHEALDRLSPSTELIP